LIRRPRADEREPVTAPASRRHGRAESPHCVPKYE
jgi:hypothetical protein